MTAVSPADLRAFVLQRVSAELGAVGLAGDEVPDDFDLLAEGVVDSLGLIELVGAIEERFGLRVDFEAIAVEDMTVLGPLCRYIAAGSGGNGSPEAER